MPLQYPRLIVQRGDLGLHLCVAPDARRQPDQQWNLGGVARLQTISALIDNGAVFNADEKFGRDSQLRPESVMPFHRARAHHADALDAAEMTPRTEPWKLLEDGPAPRAPST